MILNPSPTVATEAKADLEIEARPGTGDEERPRVGEWDNLILTIYLRDLCFSGIWLIMNGTFVDKWDIVDIVDIVVDKWDIVDT
jgi:hypothetical protein